MDTKRFAKILANRLQYLLPLIIVPDQITFMTGGESCNSTFGAKFLVHRMATEKFRGLLLSMDVEKTFDSVAWNYLSTVLHKIGLHPLCKHG